MMKYIDEFRNGDLARKLAADIAREADPNRIYNLMEFCGGHTHAISRHGIPDLIPANINLVHGPGCPVCVLPVGKIESAIRLAQDHDVILCTYADMMRVPGMKRKSLLKAKAEGADVRMVYSTQDALKIAKDNPDRNVVFFAIGFETTTPPTAVAIKAAEAAGITNFSVFCNHVLTPVAMKAILNSPDPIALDAFIGPAHVSTVIGSKPYEFAARDYGRPVVIAGFEPLDVMQSILMLVRQLNEGRCEVENEYTRTVVPDGNQKAQALVADVFGIRETFEWRGFGEVPESALCIRDGYAAFDAEKRFSIEPIQAADVKSCECGAIVRGMKKPSDCKLFGKGCTPENPMGSCMVSSEGACAAHYTYGRFRENVRAAE